MSLVAILNKLALLAQAEANHITSFFEIEDFVFEISNLIFQMTAEGCMTVLF
jgi:hypothetical protein